MKNIIVPIIAFLSLGSLAQTSVYSCQSPVSATTESEINNETDGVFYQACVDLPESNTYNFSGSLNRSVQAHERIRVGENFKAGNFNTAGGFQLKIAKSIFDVVYFDYSDLDNVLRYEKLELGVELPDQIEEAIQKFIVNENDPDAVNPFLEWELKVQATFTHVSGTQKKVDGFYYRNFKRKDDMTGWEDHGTMHDFRIRFAPPENGSWTCLVKIYLGDENNPEEVFQAIPFQFNVIESGNPGYFKVAPNKRNFMLGNKVTAPIGVNLPWAGGEYGIRNADGVLPEHYDQYRHTINEYHNNGGKYFRMFITAGVNEIEFRKVGNYYDNLHWSCEMDSVFNLIRENNQYVDFNLWAHYWLEINASYLLDIWDWDEHCGPDVTNGYKSKFGYEKPSEIFLNEESLNYVKQRYRYLLSRWGYSTQIYVLELMSETGHIDTDNEREFIQNPWNPDDPNDTVCGPYNGVRIAPYLDNSNSPASLQARNSMFQFNKGVSEYIKNNMDHDNHILSTTYLGFNFTKKLESGETVIDLQKYVQDPSIGLEAFDALGISFYKPDANRMWGPYDNITALHNAINKPIYMSEGGPTDNFVFCDQLTTAHVDSWTTLFGGFAGFQLWTGSDLTNTDFPNGPPLWKYPIRVEKFFNNQPWFYNGVINTKWTKSKFERKRCGNSLKTGVAYGYVSDNKENAFGMVYNRTYNHYTNRDQNMDTDGYPNNTCYEGELSDSDNDGPCNYNYGYHYSEDDYLNYPIDMDNYHMARRLKLNGLDNNSNYVVIWYNPDDPNFVNQAYIRYVGPTGKLRLRHPYHLTGTSERPILLFSAKKLDLSKSMIIDSTTSIQEKELIEELNDGNYIRVYPNPATDNISVEALLRKGKYSITDFTGKKIYQGIYSFGESINITDLTIGVYYITISNEGEVITTKFVKQ